jgi:hypothetical protein
MTAEALRASLEDGWRVSFEQAWDALGDALARLAPDLADL